jgi:YihY family inner membrane protein
MRRVDAFQQRHTPFAFIFAIIKKFGDDNAGTLSAQLTYSMFTTVFPLLLVLVTVLDLVLAHDPAWRLRVLHSTFGEFPIVGHTLATDIHPLHRSSEIGIAIGLILLLYGSTGLAGAGLFVMEQIWNLPGAGRPNYVTRLTRSLVFLAVLAVGVVLTTVLSGFGTFGNHNVALGILSELVAGLLNVALYLVAFRVLTPKQVATNCLVPGAVVAGILWTVLQAVGGYVVGHDLRGASEEYGLFALVLGLLAWMYLAARVTVYAAELNVVLARRLWPRGMVQPPLTAADMESMAAQATQNRRRPEQHVETHFVVAPQTQDEYRDNDFKLDERAGLVRKEPNDDPTERSGPATEHRGAKEPR